MTSMMDRRGAGRRFAVAMHVTFGLLGLLSLTTGCDAGKAPYQEAVDLDEKGQLQQAAEKYDVVCKRAPDSKLCPTATSRAAAIRLKLAQQDIDAMKFGDAEGILKTVQDTGDTDGKGKAKTQLASKELTQGLAYEKALAKADKHAALVNMETVAASGTPIAVKANEWLTKERPALLLADATAACTPNPTPGCPAPCGRLLKLHPGTPEAAKAAEYMTAFKAAEEVRLYPLLVQAEKLIEDCQGIWKANRRLQDCQLQALAADPNNPLAALAACGGNFAGDDAHKRRQKLDETWQKLIADMGVPERVGPLDARLKKSCDDGEYEKQVPKNPQAAPPPVAKAGAAADTDGPITTYCPNGLVAEPYRWGCTCHRTPGDESSADAPGPMRAGVPLHGCQNPDAKGSACIWRCPGQ